MMVPPKLRPAVGSNAQPHTRRGKSSHIGGSFFVCVALFGVMEGLYKPGRPKRKERLDDVQE